MATTHTFLSMTITTVMATRCAELCLSGHQPDRRGLRSPSKRKRLGDIEPSTAIACTVVRAHAGTLAVVPNGVPTSGRALLHFTVRLNDVETSISFQATINETVEPAHWKLPCFLDGSPCHLGLPASGSEAEKPAPVIGAVWQSCCELITGNSGADNDWDTCAVPLALNLGRDSGSIHKILFLYRVNCVMYAIIVSK